MPDEAAADKQPATGGPLVAPAAPSSGANAKVSDDGYDPQWVTKLTPHHKADLEEFFKDHPVHKELHALKSEIGRREKWGNLPKELIEAMTDASASFEEYKALVLDLGVATRDEMELAQTPRELRLLLHGRKPASVSATQTPAKNGEENPFFAQFDAWAKARGIEGKPSGGAVKQQPLSLNSTGQATPEPDYKQALRSGKPMPSAAEIDHMTARFLSS